MTNLRRLVGSTSILPLLAAFAAAFTVAVARGQQSSNETAPTAVVVAKKQVALDRLPELFSNAQLPGHRQGFDKCLHLLGCLETLPDAPLTDHMLDPTRMRTLFRIFTRQDELLVPFRPTINCLEKQGSSCDTFPYDLSLLSASHFNPAKRTIIVVDGWRSDEFHENDLEIKDAWLAWEDVNVILTAWSGGNHGVYKAAVANTKVMARQITVLLYYLSRIKGVGSALNDAEFCGRLQFVGHSLGAHIAGFVGQDLSGRLGRITGLDPAGPLFVNKKAQFRLDKSSARLVEVVHTNGGQISIMNPKFYGLATPIGHLDFYANGGQHQPNCAADQLGCSHKMAVELYKAFLRHELHTRKPLEAMAQDFRNYHRIFAYASDTYESFLNGSSLMQRCPRSTLDDRELHSADINRCLVPMDFMSRPQEFSDELVRDYGIQLHPYAPAANRFFFETQKDAPYLSYQQLLRARVTKANQRAAASSQVTECNLRLEMRMSSGQLLEKRVNRYRLMEAGDHYEILLPFLLSNLASKYELANLDAHDFHMDSQDMLRQALLRVFPASIQVHGLRLEGAERKRRSGLVAMFESFLGLAGDESEDNGHECSLSVASVSVRPLKRLHRHLEAVYSVGASAKTAPDLVYLLDESSALPKIRLSLPTTDTRTGRLASESDDEDDYDSVEQQQANSEIYLDTVIVGPRDPHAPPPLPPLPPLMPTLAPPPPEPTSTPAAPSDHEELAPHESQDQLEATEMTTTESEETLTTTTVTASEEDQERMQETTTLDPEVERRAKMLEVFDDGFRTPPPEGTDSEGKEAAGRQHPWRRWLWIGSYLFMALCFVLLVGFSWRSYDCLGGQFRFRRSDTAATCANWDRDQRKLIERIGRVWAANQAGPQQQ